MEKLENIPFQDRNGLIALFYEGYSASWTSLAPSSFIELKIY